MKEIPLTRGYVALIDDEDFEKVSAKKWSAVAFKHLVYAVHWWREGKVKKANKKMDKINDKAMESVFISTPEFTLTKGSDSTMNTLIDNTNKAVVNNAINSLQPGAITNIKSLKDGKALNLDLDDKSEVSKWMKTLTAKQIDEYVKFKTNADGSTTYTIKVPKSDAISEFKNNRWFTGYDLSGGFELSFKTSRGSNEMGVPTAMQQQLNALGSSNAGYNDQRYAVEAKGANFNYRYNATTGKPLTYGDALGMATGQIPSSYYTGITGNGDSGSVEAIIERAKIKAQSEIMNYIAKTGRYDYFDPETQSIREEVLLMHMQNNADTPIY